MKKISKITFGLATVSLIIVGCATAGNTINDGQLSLRKAPVHTEKGIAPKKADYIKAAPGQAKTFVRSYDNAPPLIPHSVKGFVPITKSNNACLSCHMPEVAKSMNATPIPPSHFVSFRPTEIIAKNGKLIKKGRVVAVANGVNKVYATPTHGKLYPGRYNCTQCHIAQTNAKPLVKNNFTPGYQSPKEMKRSDLINTFDQGINTMQ